MSRFTKLTLIVAATLCVAVQLLPASVEPAWADGTPAAPVCSASGYNASCAGDAGAWAVPVHIEAYGRNQLGSDVRVTVRFGRLRNPLTGDLILGPDGQAQWFDSREETCTPSCTVETGRNPTPYLYDGHVQCAAMRSGSLTTISCWAHIDDLGDPSTFSLPVMPMDTAQIAALPGFDVEIESTPPIETPASTIPQTCVPLVVCVGPIPVGPIRILERQNLPMTLRISATDLTVSYHVVAGLYMVGQPIGPITVSVPLPFIGDIPITLCPETCPAATPPGARITGSLTVTVTLGGGTSYSETVPINVSI